MLPEYPQPWVVWNVEESPEEPTWKPATEEETKEFFDLTDNCETVNLDDTNTDND